MVKVPYALSGTRVGFPHTANRSEQWSCPECHAEVIVKRGDIKVPHFAHKASQSGCRGETFAHSSTKEWIAANVQSPGFRITSTCTGCCEPFTAFRGARGLAGATEVQIEAYRADAAAVECGRLVAAFEVLHSHKTGARKMATLLARTYCRAFEVKSVNLVDAGYPLVFESARPLRCKLCTITAAIARRDRLERARTMHARKLGRRWHSVAAARVAARERKFARRWLFLHRVRRVAARARALHEAGERGRFAPCGKCGRAVELYTWQKRCPNCGSCDCDTGFAYIKHPTDRVEADGTFYHRGCSPRCSGCGEVKRPGKWCSCDKAARRKCVDCGTWKLKDAMSSFVNPPQSSFETSWVCKACSVECRTCSAKISKGQARYGGACFTCNRRAKRKRNGHDDESPYYCECGKQKKPEFDTCYSCYTE